MTLKRFLPSKKYTLVTKLTVAESCARISAEVQSKKTSGLFSGFANVRPYVGEINVSSFSITRIIDYRNSFLPLIKAHISSQDGETRIEINMRPAASVIIFMCFWLGIVCLVCVSLLFCSPKHNEC